MFLGVVADFGALGLLGGRTLDLNNRDQRSTQVDTCAWIVTLSGTTFEPVPGADPGCGRIADPD